MSHGWGIIAPNTPASQLATIKYVAQIIDWANLQRTGTATTNAAKWGENKLISGIAARDYMDARIRNYPAYCADANRNYCNVGTNCYDYVNNRAFTMWDGTLFNPRVLINGKLSVRARSNSFGIRALTWACRTGNSAPPGNAGADCDAGNQKYCWCSFSRDPDTDPDTFVNGKWSSWIFGYDYTNYYSVQNDCLSSCAAACNDRIVTLAPQVSW
ncbi:MAG: hypothetical protein LBO08_02495 [Rickettsiales bacterium]|nr:hypothetical protein [Rickettsiales bacterium]